MFACIGNCNIFLDSFFASFAEYPCFSYSLIFSSIIFCCSSVVRYPSLTNSASPSALASLNIIFTSVAAAFKKLEIGETVTVSAPSAPHIHSYRNRFATVKSVIRMQVILFVLEVLANPIQTEIVKSLSGNTAAFFRIENILNLAIGYTKFMLGLSSTHTCSTLTSEISVSPARWILFSSIPKESRFASR